MLSHPPENKLCKALYGALRSISFSTLLLKKNVLGFFGGRSRTAVFSQNSILNHFACPFLVSCASAMKNDV